MEKLFKRVMKALKSFIERQRDITNNKIEMLEAEMPKDSIDFKQDIEEDERPHEV